jgi:hypothetical protein
MAIGIRSLDVTNNMAIGIRSLDVTNSCVWRSFPCTLMYETRGDFLRWDTIVTSQTNVPCLDLISQPRAPGCIICNNVTGNVGLLNIAYCLQMKTKSALNQLCMFQKRPSLNIKRTDYERLLLLAWGFIINNFMKLARRNERLKTE